METIYILTALSMLILHMLLYKKEKKQNIVKWLSINIIMCLCYNILVCVILTFIKIPSTLISLSIINMITNIGLGIKIYKDKKIQKYSIDIIDILVMLAIFIITIVVVINQYGIPFDIKSIISDAAIHYFAAEDFYKYSYLLIEQHSDVQNLFNLPLLQPGAYINTGILFKVFAGLVGETYLYILYYIFDIMIWILSGMLMYGLLIKNDKKKKKILPAIFTIIYMIGYPLNSLITGFSYLTLGISIITAILIIMQEKINKYYKYILMLFLSIGLLFTYYFFAPVVYLAIFLEIIKDIKKNDKKILTFDNILNISCKLIIPAIFWLLYFVVFQEVKIGSGPNYGTVLNMEGYIYENFITNNLIFFILSIYYIIHCFLWQRKKITNNILIIHVIFMQILLFGRAGKIVSNYYYYKTYYLLWLLVITVGFDGIKRLISIGKKTKYATFVGTGIYIAGVIYAIIACKNIFIFDIYMQNRIEIELLTTRTMRYEEIELIDYYNKNININRDDKDTYICASKYISEKYRWIYSLTKNINNYIELKDYEEFPYLENFIKNDKKYFLIFKEDYGPQYDSIYEKINGTNIKIIFETEEGMILEKI